MSELSHEAMADALGLSGERREKYIQSHLHPPFSGHLEFTLTIGLLGKKVERDARIKFELVPEWPYLDPTTNKIVEGWPRSEMSIEVLSKPFYGSRSEREPRWVGVDLFEEGILNKPIWEAIDDNIDRQCKSIDAERRTKAGMA